MADRGGLAQITRVDGGDVEKRYRQVRSGTCYAYRVRAGGDELTLLIKRSQNTGWRVQDLRSSSGSSASGATVAAVGEWLGRAQGKFR